MEASSTSSSASAKPPKAHKVRDSCNACSAHKIRCGKERPRCSRCASRGLDCHYSVSRRTGQRLPWGQPPMMPGTDNTHSSTPQPQYTSTGMGQPTSAADHMDLAAYAQYDLSSLGSPASSDDLNNIFSLQPSLSYTGSSSCPDTTMDGLFASTVEWDDTASTIGKTSSLEPSRTKSKSISDQDTLFDFNTGAINSLPTPRHSSTSWRSTPPTRPPLPTPFQSSRQNQRAHSCALTTLEVVASLMVVEQGCLTASETADDETDHLFNNTNEIRDPATILESNALASQRLNKILSCPCTADQDVLVAIYLALHKIISWYGAIVGITDGSRDTLLRRISNGPIYMGTFCLDAQAHRVVRAQIVLTQLRENIEPLVKKLGHRTEKLKSNASMHGSTDSNASSAVADADINLVESYHSAILDRIERTIAGADSIKQS